MITRYERIEISEIWSEESRAKAYLEVELALLSSLEKHGEIPIGTKNCFDDAKINVERINEIELEVKHDIIAFCTSITEQVDPEYSKYFHFGVTSSDIIDTAQSLQIKQSLKIILESLKQSKLELLELAKNNISVIGVGRSHGMYAEALSYGQKFLGFYTEFSRRYNDLNNFYHNELTGQLSGAVGNYTILNPEVEKDALETLGLTPESLSTQVIPRDRIAKLTSILASLAGAIERFSVEIRHLHRSEVGEVFEGFSKGQKGSSTMPHKKNPISTENLTGISRVIRSHTLIALENNILWHERDISHSSAERVFLPDTLGLTQYALKRLNSTVKNLVVKEEVIEERSANSAGVLSSYYLHELIKKAPLKREDIYTIIQKAAFENMETKEEFHIIINKELSELNINIQIEKVDMNQLKQEYRRTAKNLLQRVLDSYPLE